MPIEFRCTQCHKLLRTPDDSAGKMAECPVCGERVTIPDPASPPPLPAVGVPPDRWAAELLPIETGSSAPAPRIGIHEPRLEIGEVLSTTWKILLRRFGTCVTATLAATFVVTVAAISLSIPFFLTEILAAAPRQRAVMLPLLIGVGFALAELFLHSVFMAGQAAFFLKIARGQPATLVDFFAGWRWALPVFLVYLMEYLIVFLGLLLFVVPGIISAIMFSQAIFVVVDRDATVGEASGASRQLTTGHKLNLFFLFLTVWGLSTLAAIPCYLGLIVLLPFKGLLTAVIYLRLSGQPIDGDAGA